MEQVPRETERQRKNHCWENQEKLRSFLTVIDVRKLVFGWKLRRMMYCIVLQIVREHGDLWTKKRERKARFPLILTAKKRREHFKSKFNNRRPLSLHPPVPMVTDKSGLFPNAEDVNPEETERIVRNLEKNRVERHKTGIEKYVFRLEGNETKGEKTIKLAREKNTLPEVIIKHRLHEREKQHFLPRVNDKVWSARPSSMNRPIDFDTTLPSGNQYARDPLTKRSVLAWSACVVPATLVDFPVRKRSPLMTSLKRPRKRVQNNMADALGSSGKPAAYTEQRAQVLPRTSAGKPLSRLLYPLHHGY